MERWQKKKKKYNSGEMKRRHIGNRPIAKPSFGYAQSLDDWSS